MEPSTDIIEPKKFIDISENDRSNPVVALSIAIVAGCLLSLLNISIGRFVPIPLFGTPLAHLVSVVYLSVLLFALMRAAQAATRLPVSPGFLVASGFVLAIPVFVSILSGVGAAIVSHPFAALAGIFDALPFSVRFVTSNLLGPLGMVLIGAGVGKIFRHTNTLLAGAGFAIFFDLVVVTMGTVAQLMKSGSDVITNVSVGAGATGVAGSHHHTIPPLSTVTIGPADVLFIAVFLAAVHALRLASRQTFYLMYALLLTALILVETTALPIPALVPMGLAVLIANGRFAAFTKTEKRDLLIGGGFALLCAALIIGGARRLLPSPPPRLGFALGYIAETHEYIVTRVEHDSTADKGGLRPHDVLVSIAGVPAAQLTEDVLLHAREATGGIPVRIRREGESQPRDLILRPVKN